MWKENMPRIDASAIQIMLEIVVEYQHRGIDVCFVKLRNSNKELFLRSGLLGDILESEFFFRKIADAVEYLHGKWGQLPHVDSNGRSIVRGSRGYSTYAV
jgi:MFS superfamily sulfate permease-like transporter